MVPQQAFEDVNDGVAKIGLWLYARMQEQKDIEAFRD
jgi:hypothetical protein